MKRVIIVGAGDFGRELSGWLQLPKGMACGFIDDTEEKGSMPNAMLPNAKVLGSIIGYCPKQGDELLMGISDPAGKKAVATQLLARGAKFGFFVHRLSVVSSGVFVGPGCVIGPFVSLSTGCIIGDFVTINAYSGPGHDSEIESFATMAAHVNVCGHCRVGEGAYLASGSTVLPHVRIGHGAQLSAGSVAWKNVPDGAVFHGNPARRLK